MKPETIRDVLQSMRGYVARNPDIDVNEAMTRVLSDDMHTAVVAVLGGYFLLAHEKTQEARLQQIDAALAKLQG